MTPQTERFKQILRDNGISITAARLALFDTLLNHQQPLKNGEVAALTPSVNRASVYRTLELFDHLGITTTLVRGWTPFVELAEPFKPHHHHLLCDQCGIAIEVTSDKIESIIHEITKSQSFTPTSHHFEINGVCQGCREKINSTNLQ